MQMSPFSSQNSKASGSLNNIENKENIPWLSVKPERKFLYRKTNTQTTTKKTSCTYVYISNSNGFGVIKQRYVYEIVRNMDVEPDWCGIWLGCRYELNDLNIWIS